LANNEEHLFNILNEKIVWKNNDNNSASLANKKQFSLSLVDIEEACNKFYNIINQSEEKFLNTPSEYPDFLINKKKIENLQTQTFSNNLIAMQTSNSNENNNIQKKEYENLEKNDEKSNNDNELLCEDEVKINKFVIFLIIFQ